MDHANTLDRRRLLRQASAGAAFPAALALGGIAGSHDPAAATAAGASGTPGLPPKERPMTTGGLDPDRARRVRAVMQRHVDAGTIPGVVTLVGRGGEAHVEAVGNTTFDGGDPMRRDTIFRIASVTKPILAAAAMILVEECVLRLDDPVDALLPELADRQVLRSFDGPIDDTEPANRPITLRDLLTFRLGYGAIFEQTPLAQATAEAQVAAGPHPPAFSPEEYLARLGNLPLAHQPGERWLYNTGFDVLGVLIARATGSPLGAFLGERIFEPLGMVDTGFHVPPDKIGRLAGSYWTDFATGEFGEFDGIEDSRFAAPPVFESGAAGLVSTVDDLLAFGEMMLNEGVFAGRRILSRPSVELMTTDQITAAQKAASPFFPADFWDTHGWGLGVAVITRRDDISMTPGRFGWDGGYGTSWYVDPAEGLIGILMTQRGWDGRQEAIYGDFWTTAYQAIAD